MKGNSKPGGKNKRVLINGSMITKVPTGVRIHNIELLSYLLPKLELNHIDYHVFCYDAEILRSAVPEVKIKPITLGTYIDFLFKRFLSIHRILWNIFLLKKIALQYDLVYSPSTYGGFIKKDQIITIHDLIALSFPKQHKFQFLYYKYLLPVILKHCTKIIAISNFTKTEILRCYPFIKSHQVTVIKNGIDHIKDTSDAESDILVKNMTGGKDFCLSVGASYYHKNIHSILKVAALLKNDNVNFVIVGQPTSYYKALEKQCKKQDLKNVLLLNYVSNATLSSLYKNTFLHIYISLYEGFGFPPAEAAFFGTNSLISNHPALVEIYGSCFPIAHSKKTEDIALQIKESHHVQHKTSAFEYLRSLYNWNNAAFEVFKVIQDEHC